jgi:hypothetical protein
VPSDIRVYFGSSEEIECQVEEQKTGLYLCPCLRQPMQLAAVWPAALDTTEAEIMN